jgi:hypothetical protein
MPIVSIKAGRCKRRGETNWVDPQPAKGRIEIEENDGLLTFCEYGQTYVVILEAIFSETA